MTTENKPAADRDSAWMEEISLTAAYAIGRDRNGLFLVEHWFPWFGSSRLSQTFATLEAAEAYVRTFADAPKPDMWEFRALALYDDDGRRMAMSPKA